MGYTACEHVHTLKETEDVSTAYELLHAFYVACITPDSFARKAEECLCMVETCVEKHRRVHACLSCVYYGCYNEKHFHAHAEETNHFLALDTDSGYVFCAKCGDYQYDPEFEEIARRHEKIRTKQRGPSINLSYEPSEQEMELVSKLDIIDVSSMGLRGLLNMGNTCYMNVIIQSLVNTPAFRDYFLSLKHCVFHEETRNECFACIMSDIVQELFSGKKDPCIPSQLLYLLWMKDETLIERRVDRRNDRRNDLQVEGYSGQDPHHCYLTILINLHQNFEETGDIPPMTEFDERCKCLVDSIFTGIMVTENSCGECKNVSSIHTETFRSIALDYMHLAFEPLTKTQQGAPIFLDDCLKKALEIVCISDYKCENCKQTVICSKKITRMELPVVLTFHIKHPPEKGQYFVNFPEYLNMAPYLVFDGKAYSGDAYLDTLKYKYYLFAVVEFKPEYKKKLSHGGHYICYVRQLPDKWFCCNDSEITLVKLEEVLKTTAYLLFYHREFLNHDTLDS